jgi:RimJ/RimL family protein N-acetyltransferase
MTSAELSPVVQDDAVLRLLIEADLPVTLGWRNHPESRGWFHSTGVISPDQHRQWFARYRERDDDYVFVLELAGTPVAQTALYDIAGGSAEFGRMLVDPDARGRGISHRAIALCLLVADGPLDLRELHLEVKSANARAISAYERAGFRLDRTADAPDGSIVMRRRRP